MNTTYVGWLFIFIIFPMAVLWALFFPLMWKYRSIFIKVIAISLVFGLAWDIFAFHTKMWYWPEDCCMLPRFQGVPGEEVFFISFVASYIVSMTLVVRERYILHRKHKNL